MNPEISIVVSVYNVEKYLPRCLDSLINQTFKEIEIICVNDGSTDGSLAVLRKYAEKDDRIKVVNQTNKGVAGARNRGLVEAVGKYILIFDADDWVDLNLCKKVYDIAEANNSDIVMFNVAFYDQKKMAITKGHFFSIKHWRNHNDENTLHTFRDCKAIFYGNLSCANKLYRKSFLDDLGVKFIEGTRFEDHPFHLETMFMARRINILDEQLYYYRQNRKNSMMTTLLTTKVIYDIFGVVDAIEEMIERRKLWDELKYAFFQFKCEALVHYYMRASIFARPKFYKKMKEEFYKFYDKDYDFNICKTIPKYYHFTDVINYNWFTCMVLKLLLDNEKYNMRKKVEPYKKLLEDVLKDGYGQRG